MDPRKDDDNAPRDTPHGAPRAAHFDATRDAWVLSRYADVVTALRASTLAMPGTGTERSPAHDAVRKAVAHSWTSGRLESWRAVIEADAFRRVTAIPDAQTVDLVKDFANPWSLELAVLSTGAPRSEANVCATLARTVLLSSAHAKDGTPHDAAMSAAAELSQRLASADALGEASATVQAFVAVSQTLPALLAAAWLAMLADQKVQSTLRAQVVRHRHLEPRAVNELLRVAGPAQVVFRQALEDIEIGGAQMRAGDRAIVELCSGNHDAARFANPERADCTREALGHLAFGAGLHACAGANLVRMALDVATSALLRGASHIELDATAPAEWIDGFAIRAPAALNARLYRTTASRGTDRTNT